MENVHGFPIGATRFDRYRLYFELNKLFVFIQAISEETQNLRSFLGNTNLIKNGKRMKEWNRVKL